MTKKIFLMVMISACIIMMSNSASAVEYRVLDDHKTTMMVSIIEKIDNTLEKHTSFFKHTNRDVQKFTTQQEWEILEEKITDLKSTIVNTFSQLTSGPIALQFILELIITIIIALFIATTALVLVVSGFISLLITGLVSLGIILIQIINFILST